MSNPKKFILDATAGFHMMWFNKNHPNCIYLDNRPECEPDIVGDFRDLKQFPDETFRLIVFDPPHMVYFTKKSPSFLTEKFGLLQRETWQSDLQKAFNELWRVLKPYGILIFKWNDNHISTKKVLKLFSEKPLFGQVVGGSRGVRRKGSSEPRSRTSYFCFMKIPEQEVSGG